jgi:hypothetical protein
MTWPVIARLGTHIPGSEGDAWVHLWTARWVRGALFDGQPLFHTNLIFYPQGTPLTSHNIAWVNIAIWLMLQFFTGEAIAYSLMMLVVYVLNGFAVFLLAKEIIRSDAAAFIAGLIGAFWPSTLSHFNSPNMSLMAWVPLAMLYLKRTLERQRLKDALLAALFIALIGITRWQMLVLGGILIGLFYICLLLRHHEYRTRRTAGLTLLIMTVAMLIMLPLLLPPALDQITRTNADEPFTSSSHQTDLLAYVIPSRFHLWWGKAAFDRFYGKFVSVAFIGYVVLALAFLGIIKRWRQARFWLLGAAIYMLFALGPALLVNGQRLIPLPYDWLDGFFLFHIIRNPLRFNVVLAIPVAILSGLGTLTIQRNLGFGRRRVALAIIIIGLLVLFEYAVRVPTLPTEVPAWYEKLGQEEGDFAILELPMQTRVHDEYYMHYQFEHGKALVGGMVSRPPSEAFEFIDSLPLLRAVRRDFGPPDDISRFSEQFARLSEAGVRYLILHKDRLDDQQLAAWREWLGLAPEHEDDDLVLYHTELQLGRDLPVEPTGVPGLAIVAADYAPRMTTQAGWVTVEFRWGSLTGLDQEYDVCFVIDGQGDENQRRICLPLSPEWPTANWSTNEVVDVRYPLNFDPFLESGNYTVTAEIVTKGEIEGVSHPLPIGEVSFSAIERVFASDSELVPREFIATFGQDMALINYTLNSAGTDSLEVDLHWLALRRMGNSYKVFLHLIDPASGDVVSQVDTAPRNWGYPTTWWEQGEIVNDALQLTLADVTPGAYELFIGLYDEATGERLPIMEESGDQNSSDRLFLTAIER